MPKFTCSLDDAREGMLCMCGDGDLTTLHAIMLSIPHSELSTFTREVDGFNCCQMAVHYNQLELLRGLVETYHVRTTFVNPITGFTAIIQAAQQGHLGMLKFLVDEIDYPNDESRHAAINAVTVQGVSAFMLSVNFGHVKVARWLARNGADIHMEVSLDGTVSTAQSFVNSVADLKKRGLLNDMFLELKLLERSGFDVAGGELDKVDPKMMNLLSEVTESLFVENGRKMSNILLPKICHGCGKSEKDKNVKMKMCGLCASVSHTDDGKVFPVARYCSKDCQRNDWLCHKVVHDKK